MPARTKVPDEGAPKTAMITPITTAKTLTVSIIVSTIDQSRCAPWLFSPSLSPCISASIYDPV